MDTVPLCQQPKASPILPQDLGTGRWVPSFPTHRHSSLTTADPKRSAPPRIEIRSQRDLQEPATDSKEHDWYRRTEMPMPQELPPALRLKRLRLLEFDWSPPAVEYLGFAVQNPGKKQNGMEN